MAIENAKKEIVHFIQSIKDNNSKLPKNELEEMINKFLISYIKDTEQRQLLTGEILKIAKQQNSVPQKIFVDWILKTMVVTFVQKIGEMIFHMFSVKFDGDVVVVQASYDTKKLFSSLKTPKLSELTLSESHRALCENIINKLKEIHNDPTAIINTPILFIFSGVGGTGKSATSYAIAKFVLKNFSEKNTFFLTSLLRKLPFFVRAMFNIYEDKKTLVLSFNGAFLYNYSDVDKAAGLLDSIFKNIEKYIFNHPERKVILLIEEGEAIFNIPQFVTVAKEKLSTIQNLHSTTKMKKGGKKVRQHGVFFIIVTTNDPAKINVYLSRRAVVSHFGYPTAMTTLSIFYKYIDDILGKNNYTETIKDYAVHIVRLCIKFSPSDIENILSMLKFNVENKEVVTLLDILEIIRSTLLKIEIIVKKQDENDEEIIKNENLLKVEESIYKINDFYNGLFNKDLYDSIMEENIEIDINNIKNKDNKDNNINIDTAVAAA